MSAGSTNIVVQITDQVDSTIAPKIREIANAARDANTYLIALQSAVSNVTGGTAKLGSALNQLNPNLGQAAAGASRLEGAFAQLIARVAGAEAGLGMLGGAFGRVGVAAGFTGPLIIGGLAIAAIGAAILIYEKFEASARKLVEAQIAMAEQFSQNHTKILEQQEDLIGLTQGPMAKYIAELNDLSKKDITLNISNITKELDDQKSTFATLLSYAQRYDLIATKVSSAPVTINNAKDFISQQKLNVSESIDKEKALQDALVATGNKLVEIHKLEATQSEKSLAITEVSRKGIEKFYKEETDQYQEFLNNKQRLTLGANGELLSEQRRASQEELRLFNEQLSQLKTNANGVVSPQAALALRTQQLSQFDKEHPGDTNQSSPFAAARDTLVKDRGNLIQTIERETRSLGELVDKYKLGTQTLGAYSTQLKIEAEQQKAVDEVTRLAPDNKNTPATIEQLKQLVQARVLDAEAFKEEGAIFAEFQGPIDKYNASITASTKLLKDGSISAEEKAIADNKATRAVTDAINPLNEYTIGLEHEVALLGQYGRALTVATEVDRVRQELQKQGRDLTSDQATALNKYLTQLERQKAIQSEVNQLYIQNAEFIQRAAEKQAALNVAVGKGIISTTQYKIETAQLNIALANQQLLDERIATVQNQLVAGIGKYISGFQGLAKGLSDAYGQAFTTIADGAANSLGRAIAYGENLGAALKDVARTAVSELLSSFIKLGIQWVVLQVIGQTVAATASATTTALAGSVAAAWAPAAAFASLASFGANAAPAAAAVTGTVALSEALALVTGHKDGGLITGPGGTDRLLRRLTSGEFVVNAQATAQNLPLLDSINRGKTNSGSSGYGGMQVYVEHDGSTAIAVQHLSENRVRIIAKQEALTTVQTHAPGIIASDIVNPNSRTSKAISQHVNAPRRRNN